MAPTATSSLVTQGQKVLLVGTSSASPSDLTEARNGILSSVGSQGSVIFEQLDRLATGKSTEKLKDSLCLITVSSHS